MAELLVRVINKKPLPDVYMEATHTKRGDVIVVQPDGWKWGRMESGGTEFAVIKAPGLLLKEAQELTREEVGDRRVNRVLHARGYGLNLTGSGLEITKPGIYIRSAAAVRNARFKKAPAKDPFRFD